MMGDIKVPSGAELVAMLAAAKVIGLGFGAFRLARDIAQVPAIAVSMVASELEWQVRRLLP